MNYYLTSNDFREDVKIGSYFACVSSSYPEHINTSPILID